MFLLRFEALTESALTIRNQSGGEYQNCSPVHMATLNFPWRGEDWRRLTEAVCCAIEKEMQNTQNQSSWLQLLEEAFVAHTCISRS